MSEKKFRLHVEPDAKDTNLYIDGVRQSGVQSVVIRAGLGGKSNVVVEYARVDLEVEGVAELEAE